MKDPAADAGTQAWLLVRSHLPQSHSACGHAWGRPVRSRGAQRSERWGGNSKPRQRPEGAPPRPGQDPQLPELPFIATPILLGRRLFFLLFLHLRCKGNREWERGPAGWRGAAGAATRPVDKPVGSGTFPWWLGLGQAVQGEGCVSQGNAPGLCGPEVWVQSRRWVLKLAGRAWAEPRVEPTQFKGTRWWERLGRGTGGALALPGKPAVWVDDPLHPDRPPRLSRPRAVEDASLVFR